MIASLEDILIKIGSHGEVRLIQFDIPIISVKAISCDFSIYGNKAISHGCPWDSCVFTLSETLTTSRVHGRNISLITYAKSDNRISHKVPCKRVFYCTFFIVICINVTRISAKIRVTSDTLTITSNQFVQQKLVLRPKLDHSFLFPNPINALESHICWQRIPNLGL